MSLYCCGRGGGGDGGGAGEGGAGVGGACVGVAGGSAADTLLGSLGFLSRGVGLMILRAPVNITWSTAA